MKQKSQFVLIAPAIIAILIPAAYILYLTSQSGELSNFDYWWITWNFYTVDGFSTNPFNWIFRANEHFLLIPSVIYALNIVVTKGSNIGLSLITWIFAWIQCHILIAMLPLSIRRSRFMFICLLLCISIFNFTPAAAHNWMRGFSGVAWMGANLFVIASIFSMTKIADIASIAVPNIPQGLKSLSHSKSPLKRTEKQSKSLAFFRRIQLLAEDFNPWRVMAIDDGDMSKPKYIKWLIASIVFALLGSMSYSTSLALWPVLCIFPVLVKLPRKVIISYITAAILVVGTYFLTYKTPSNSPSLAKLSLGDTITYIPVYLGGIFSNKVTISLIVGIIGLIAATGFGVYWLLSKNNPNRREWLPWLSIQTYAIATAFMAAVSRSGFGVEQATASRYASLPALFWIGLIVVTILWFRQWQLTFKIQGRFLIPLLAVVAFAIISMYQIGGQTADAIAYRATYQPLVALSLQLGITDVSLIKERVGNKPAAFIGLIDALKANNLVPFNRDVKQHNFCAAIDEKINPNLLSPPKDGVPGYFDTVTKFTPKAARVIGWVGDPENKVKCIAILNQENVIRGFAMSGFPRPDLVKIFGQSYEFSAWRGYIEISPVDKMLTAYASFKNREGWIALRNSQFLQKN
ncbi:hypothetical protein [Kamptonema sp. UHCC 0994]|uniref:hypothetical protein n=1 Tax=Kamptonema sp. UHCC 0994 TaxID=3031329 RepID=UPI0023B8E4C0|nr:hypothetical protein [Kamptonema sp. UHCC 0994]MDF0554805.1 hypothetical protein [Kamptonema sp. UHCC 0994]